MKKNKGLSERFSLSKKEYKKVYKMNPQIKADDSLIIKRLNTLMADNELSSVITSHADYQDKKGIKGTSPKGYKITLNKLIKKLFGKSVGEIVSGFELEGVNMIRCKIAQIIRDGERIGSDRKKIKEEIKTKIPIIYDNLFG